MTPNEATAAGYWPLTSHYNLPNERWALDRVLAHFTASGINVRLVGTDPRHPEVWRDGRQFTGGSTVAVPEWANVYEHGVPMSAY